MLRKAIAAYTRQLEAQAERHTRFAGVLKSVAHRLRHILADNPPPVTFTEYGYLGGDGKIHIIDTLDASHGPKLYERRVTEWKEMR